MTHGSFFWHDVMTSDPKAAAAFYGAVVGWGVQDSGMAGMDYTLLTLPGGEAVAGIMPIPDEMKGHAHPAWMTYIAADDVDAAAKAITAAGGVIHRGPQEVPGVIRFAPASDPQGAAFIVGRGLGDQPMPQHPRGTPGTTGWHELYAGEWESAFAFYEAVFGWTKAEAFDMGPMGTYQLFAAGAEPVGGMMTKPPQIPAAVWGVYFFVDAIDAAAERVTANGGAIAMGPMEVPGGDWVVQCRDPQGAAFALTASRR